MYYYHIGPVRISDLPHSRARYGMRDSHPYFLVNTQACDHLSWSWNSVSTHSHCHNVDLTCLKFEMWPRRTQLLPISLPGPLGNSPSHATKSLGQASFSSLPLEGVPFTFIIVNVKHTLQHRRLESLFCYNALGYQWTVVALEWTGSTAVPWESDIQDRNRDCTWERGNTMALDV